MATEPSHAASKRLRLLYDWIPVLVALPLLLWHASQYMPYMPDDSLIVARYAERLIEGHGLTWTDGERVEGYSNLLWTVSVAALAGLGLEVLDAARVLGVLCMSSVFYALARAYRPRSLVEVIVPTLAAVMLAAAGPIAAWTIGGLEATMVAALLAWSLVLVFPILDGEDESNRRVLLVGIPLGLLCWTRPDGPLFTAVFAGVIVVVFRLRRRGWALAMRVTALPVIAVAMQLGFRLLYYHDWLPNPAYIKARVHRERVLEGIEYVVGAWEWMIPALVLAGLGLVVSFVAKHQRARASLLVCCFAAWSVYLVLVGGDIFAARRHWVPLWLLLAFTASVGWSWVVRRERVWLSIVATIASLAAIGWLVKLQLDDPRNRLAMRQIWQWEGEVLARVLGEGFRNEQPLIAVTAAGTIPYFSKLPSLDMLGLNDRYIARQQPEHPGDLAHDHGGGKYVLDREPDLIMFSLGIKAGFHVGRQMRRDPRFNRDYLPVQFRGYLPHERDGLVYVRIAGRVGVMVEDDAVTVPGYLLKGDGVIAQPGVDGGIDTVLPAKSTLVSPNLPVGSGTWRVTVLPDNTEVDARIAAGKRSPARVATIRDGEPVQLQVTTTVGTLLGAIRLERVGEDLAHSQPSAPPVTPSYTVEPLGTFDDGLEPWVAEGRAFAHAPSTGRLGRQKPVTGNVGPFLNSFHPKRSSKLTGKVTSPPFLATAGTVLSFRLAGGLGKTGVRLMHGERTLLTWHGHNSVELEEVRFSLTPFDGRTLHIEVFDEASRAWGHVLADEFVLLHPQR
jgi:arabinofuranosyltransferase